MNAPRLPDQLPPDWQPPADLVDAIRKDTMTTHTHHQFGTEYECDLPDTYEAHYGPRETTTPTEPRYPDVTAQLSGNDGNAFAILGAVQKALKKADVPADEIQVFWTEATSGDYNHLLATAMRWVEVE